MKTKCIMLLSFLALISGCASLQVGSDVAAGRRALLAGNNETALAYFQSAAHKDPNYRWGTAYQQSILSYVGRTEYAAGRLPQARQTLEKALNANRDEDLARLYLGLTLARSGDRQLGLKEIEGGMRGIHDWLDYINDAHRFSFGQFWDPARAIRSAIQGDLAMISGREFDWQKLIASSEWIAQRMEEESDNAHRDEARERSREGDSPDSPGNN
ncbi:MAG: tetratricopeptide repeat protein [Candidatus Binatia bacterium]